MPRLEVLDVSYNRVENGMRELALLSCPLRVLRLETNGVWAESVVLGAQKFPLEVLDLGSNPSIDLVPICHAGWRLDALDLDMCGLHDEGMAVLAEADFTTSLRRLSINQNMVTDAGLRALVEAEWPRLEELHIAELALQESERTKAGMEALATLPALRTVYLGPERVRRAIVRPLVERGVRIIAA
jgi:Ran GTPase-activating protein (RanGAP) involved in mRNA processing and transport